MSGKWGQNGQSRNNNQDIWLQLQDSFSEKYYLLRIFNKEIVPDQNSYNLRTLWKKTCRLEGNTKAAVLFICQQFAQDGLSCCIL